MSDLSLLRVCRFTPYRRGMGPVFTLTMRDAGTRDGRGVTTIGSTRSPRSSSSTASGSGC